MSHYYKYDPSLSDDIHVFNYTFKGNVLKFKTNSGVFSKERVDFGTNVLLNSLPSLEDVTSTLDVGCGVGIIGICIKKAYPKIDMTMIDVNERCIELSLNNAQENNVCANVYLSDMYEKVNESYDLILSNPPIRAGKAKVFEVVDGAYKHLNDKGSLICVIQKKQGAESLKKHMEEVFGNVEILNKESGYYIIRSLYDIGKN